MSSAYPFKAVPKSGSTGNDLDSLMDPKFPGTAVLRLVSVLNRVKALDQNTDLSGDWTNNIRIKLLHAGGLKVDRSTSHAFNDDNHCDLTTMATEVQHESNADGAISQISRRNQLGPHIQQASLPELGSGGSWSTCTNGAHILPIPNDVAHTQFRSRIAFKLVWTPVSNFTKFVLLDDEGRVLKESGDIDMKSGVPDLYWRKSNYALIKGGIYDIWKDKKEEL